MYLCFGSCSLELLGHCIAIETGGAVIWADGSPSSHVKCATDDGQTARDTRTTLVLRRAQSIHHYQPRRSETPHKTRVEFHLGAEYLEY